MCSAENHSRFLKETTSIVLSLVRRIAILNRLRFLGTCLLGQGSRHGFHSLKGSALVYSWLFESTGKACSGFVVFFEVASRETGSRLNVFNIDIICSFLGSINWHLKQRRLVGRTKLFGLQNVDTVLFKQINRGLLLSQLQG